MVDRLKRMINVSGYKVWPAEVESALYKHPAIQEAVVIAIPDARSGEAAKAMVVLEEEEKGKASKEEIVEYQRAGWPPASTHAQSSLWTSYPRAGPARSSGACFRRGSRRR